MVKGRLAGVLSGVHEDELLSPGRRSAIPEATSLGHPVGLHIRDVKVVAQVPGQKLLSTTIVVESALGTCRSGPGAKNDTQKDQRPQMGRPRSVAESVLLWS